jgi:ankyrin repeat protein
LACENGHIEVAQLLLAKNNYDIKEVNFFDDTPLKLAAKGGYVDIVRLLIAKYQTRLAPEEVDMLCAGIQGNVGEVSRLLKNSKINVNYPL